MESRALGAAYKSLLMFNTVLILLVFFGQLLENPFIFASLAASLFIIYFHPKADMAQPKNVLGGHMIAALTGYLVTFVIPAQYIALGAACAVGVSALLMFTFRLEHAPAAATALSFSYNLSGMSSYQNFVIILLMIVVLGLIKFIWLGGVRLWRSFETEGLQEAEKALEKGLHVKKRRKKK